VSGLLINGRFLAATPTGLHRTGRALVDGLRRLGVDAPVWAPAGVTDERVDRHLPAPPGRWGAHLWEQALLPARAGRRAILSLTNTGPVAAANGIVMVHDLAALRDIRWFDRSMRLYVRTSLLAARRAVRVLTVSHVVAGELVAEGVRPQRIAVVRPAVDATFVPAPAAAVADVRARLGLHGPYLVLPGWSDPRKDAATAVRAHLDAREHHDHQLVMVGGSHPTFAPVELPDVPSVVRPGWIPDADLVALLTGATALLYPTRYEGFGLPPLEAAACGTPALVSDIPVLRESAGDVATFVPPGDVSAWSRAIVDVLGHATRAGAAPEWTWDDAAVVLRDAIESWL
jgi:glycosyltransferase involved in cell wall biosynthesis